MPMTDGRIPRLAALLREAFAVLAAILIAFALDAWWDARVERADMLEALDAVAIEAERNMVRLDTAQAYNEGRSMLVQEIMSLTPADVEGMTRVDLDRFRDLPNYQLATLELGAAEAFIEGGFLATLDDRALRADIAGLPRLQTEMDEEAWVVQSSSERLNPLVLQAVPMALLREPGGPVSVESTRALLRALVDDESVLRALYERTFFLSYLYGDELKRTRDRLQEVGEQIAGYQASAR